jgi:hypothetical protein
MKSLETGVQIQWSNRSNAARKFGLADTGDKTDRVSLSLVNVL